MKKYMRPGAALQATPLEVTLRPGESADSLVKRFKKKVRSSGLSLRLKMKRCHRTPAERRRIKHEIRRAQMDR